MKDEYLSTERLSVGYRCEKTRRCRYEFCVRTVSRERSEKVVADMCGGSRITDRTPKKIFRRSTKYAEDLTERARKGNSIPSSAATTKIRTNDTDTLATNKEQSGPDRRTRRRRNRHRRRSGRSESVSRRRSRNSKEQKTVRSTLVRCSPAQSIAASLKIV